jgi:hypothetical protein
MRTTIVTGALLAFTVLTATPALAAPELTQRSCEDSGGTFSRTQGTKSCTTVTRTETPGQATVLEGPVHQEGFTFVHYVGVSEPVVVVETTTTRSQKGNGPIASTSSPQTTTTYRHYCYEDSYDLLTNSTESRLLTSLEPCQEDGLLL